MEFNLFFKFDIFFFSSFWLEKYLQDPSKVPENQRVATKREMKNKSSKGSALYSKAMNSKYIIQNMNFITKKFYDKNIRETQKNVY